MHDFCSVLHDGTMNPDNMLNYCLFLLKEERMAVVGIGETDVHSEFRMNNAEFPGISARLNISLGISAKLPKLTRSYFSS